MPEHELWVTALFNKYLAGPGNAALALVGMHAENPDKPWANFVTLQIVVFLVLVTLLTVLRPRLSMERPGGVQHFFEIVYGFLRDQTDEMVGHHGRKFLHVFATLFLFILFANELGIIPTFESPTMFAPVPLGCAMFAFLYYHFMGILEQGPLKYLAHFAGPIWWLAPIMFPIEIVSHLGRPLSLTVRLYANMFAGESVFLVFLGLTYVGSVIFMGLHVFVGALQAYIFVLLTMVYVQGAVAHDH
ncbi:MAG: F0F1 ATP synthase subunit A [Bryobacteraceae bacterium]|nr:F0F1 ATP synthase subunit A [Bryobacteraceae bacterium]